VPADVCAVVNLHREGALCVPSIQSAVEAAQHAVDRSVSTELLLVLDSSDADTVEVAGRLAETRSTTNVPFRIVSTDVADLGDARNVGVAETNAGNIAFLDSDDLWGTDWLWRAHDAALQHGEPAIFHPALSFFFGDSDEDATVYHHIPSTDPQFDQARFRAHNSWTALSFAPRELYLSWPYPRNNLHAGFGFEDWSWNEATLKAGLQHLVVPETCHFVSKDTARGSLLVESSAAVRTPYGQQL